MSRVAKINELDVKVTCGYRDQQYVGTYVHEICCGELLRNCCVNLGLDPDMTDGFVRNFSVYRIAEGAAVLWDYNPSHIIGNVCNQKRTLHIVLEPK
jgi:hypothetical protein